MQFNAISCKQKGKRVKPHVLKLIYGSPLWECPKPSFGYSSLIQHLYNWTQSNWLGSLPNFLRLKTPNVCLTEMKSLRKNVTRNYC